MIESIFTELSDPGAFVLFCFVLFCFSDGWEESGRGKVSTACCRFCRNHSSPVSSRLASSLAAGACLGMELSLKKNEVQPRQDGSVIFV